MNNVKLTEKHFFLDYTELDKHEAGDNAADRCYICYNELNHSEAKTKVVYHKCLNDDAGHGLKHPSCLPCLKERIESHSSLLIRQFRTVEFEFKCDICNAPFDKEKLETLLGVKLEVRKIQIEGWGIKIEIIATKIDETRIFRLKRAINLLKSADVLAGLAITCFCASSIFGRFDDLNKFSDFREDMSCQNYQWANDFSNHLWTCGVYSICATSALKIIGFTILMRQLFFRHS